MTEDAHEFTGAGLLRERERGAERAELRLRRMLDVTREVGLGKRTLVITKTQRRGNGGQREMQQQKSGAHRHGCRARHSSDPKS